MDLALERTGELDSLEVAVSILDSLVEEERNLVVVERIPLEVELSLVIKGILQVELRSWEVASVPRLVEE